MELGGIDRRANAERLDRAGSRTGEQNSVVRQPADRLLMPDERVKGGGQPSQQRVLPAVAGERDRNRPDRFAVPPVDDRPQVAAECPNAIAAPRNGKSAPTTFPSSPRRSASTRRCTGR